jgi:hypothetical protein
MAERKKTPNILADLLGDKGNNTTPEPGERKETSLQAVLPVKQQDAKTEKPHDSKMAKEPDPENNRVPEGNSEENEVNLSNKLKVTFYLSEESVDLLEEAQRKLRRMSRGTGKTQPKGVTSKSALLEEALKLACADLETRGKESQLARILF